MNGSNQIGIALKPSFTVNKTVSFLQPLDPMKSLLLLASFLLAAGSLHAQTAPASGSSSTPSAPAPATPPAGPSAPVAAVPATAAKILPSAVFEWDKMTVTPAAFGSRRQVFDGPTATLDKVHCHITTLNPGQTVAAPSLHLQEEIIIIKEGTIEATFDGKTALAPVGSIIYFAANAVTGLRNVGTVPATYYVISYYTPLTPKAAPAPAATPAR
jgi:mannose-6-phosphate isomerase-like protein (cupin superfamily)